MYSFIKNAQYVNVRKKNPSSLFSRSDETVQTTGMCKQQQACYLKWGKCYEDLSRLLGAVMLKMLSYQSSFQSNDFYNEVGIFVLKYVQKMWYLSLWPTV